MSSGSRRVLLYWLLLIGPAVVVGAGALLLLRREQSRLEEQAAATSAARRAAVADRARLIAENMRVLLADVQQSLGDTLRVVPDDDAAARQFLEEWRRSNPLVGEAVLVGPGEAVRSGTEAVARELARVASEAAAPPPPAPVDVAREAQVEEATARATQLANVQQYQRARTELQQTARRRGNDDLAPAAAAPAPVAVAPRPRPMAAGGMGAVVERREAVSSTVAPDEAAVRWQAVDAGHPFLVLGWREMAAGVAGVSLALTEVRDRLAEVLPVDVPPDERYWLTTERPGLEDAGGVALDPRLLPGWVVVGEWSPGRLDGGGARGFLLLGGLLVAALVAAIAAGGALLVRDARRRELEAAQKTSFVANVSHEFKTPLTTIRLYAELLEQGRVRDEVKRAAYLATIGRETERLSRLVNNALDFSRLEQGRKAFDVRETDVAADLRAVVDGQTPRLEEAGLRLELEVPAGTVPGRIDRDAFQQVVLNLLDNACKYAANGREVAVTLARGAGGGLEIRVADRGPGVPAAERERIFEKFHRLDETLTAAQGGTGLGLGIARQLARGQRGELRCEARPGGGAVFIFSLP